VRDDVFLRGSARGSAACRPERVIKRRGISMSQVSRPAREVERSDPQSNQDAEWINRKATELATRAANARQLSGRRRFVDPTTCEREYTKAEMEFMTAMNEYKRRSGRMFPTWSEVLEVLQSLGYEKVEASIPMGPQGKTTAGRPVAKGAAVG
jgi:hypothetical protein